MLKMLLVNAGELLPDCMASHHITEDSILCVIFGTTEFPIALLIEKMENFKTTTKQSRLYFSFIKFDLDNWEVYFLVV
jgi:hypothetical protein